MFISSIKFNSCTKQSILVQMKHQAYKQNYCIQIHTKTHPKILKLITPKQGSIKVYHVKFELNWANGTMSMKINKNRHNYMLQFTTSMHTSTSKIHISLKTKKKWMRPKQGGPNMCLVHAYQISWPYNTIWGFPNQSTNMYHMSLQFQSPEMKNHDQLEKAVKNSTKIHQAS